MGALSRRETYVGLEMPPGIKGRIEGIALAEEMSVAKLVRKFAFYCLSLYGSESWQEVVKAKAPTAYTVVSPPLQQIADSESPSTLTKATGNHRRTKKR